MIAAQLSWGRALLSWDESSPAQAVLGDLGWLHVTFQVLRERARLIGRMAQRAAGQERMQILLSSACATPGTWSHATMMVVQCANAAGANAELLGLSRIKAACDVLAALDTQEWQRQCQGRADMRYYHHGGNATTGAKTMETTIYSSRIMRMNKSAAYTYGRIRAGARPLLDEIDGTCPACGAACDTDILHVLKYCKATRQARHTMFTSLSHEVRGC